MMKKKCIICRKEKYEFTPEHVISASIGGAIVIDSVCKECNEMLGKNIDTPLVQSPRMSFHRQQFQIRRIGVKTRKNIPNPFRGKHKDINGNEHIVLFDENGVVSTKMIPRISDIRTTDDGQTKITYSMSREDFTNEEEIKKRLEKKLDIDFTFAKAEYEEIDPEEPLTFVAKVPNKPLILGCLKIAYEIAATFLPQFLDDIKSNLFAEILKNPSTIEDNKELFDEPLELRIKLGEKIKKIEGLAIFHHVIQLASIKGIGLVCFIKLFDFVYIIRLTENLGEALLNDITIINNSIDQHYQIIVVARLSSFTIIPKLNSLSRQFRRKLIDLDSSVFIKRNGKIPVYDKNGVELFENLNLLMEHSKLIEHIYILSEKKAELTYETDGTKYFIKSLHQPILLPLSQVKCHYDLKY